MYYIYSISVELSVIALILLITRVIINKKNINLKSGKYSWKIGLSILIVSFMPMLNIIFTLSSLYISIFMKKSKFIEFINE